MAATIPAKDAKPGMRLSMFNDGSGMGRVVAKVIKHGSQIELAWANGGATYCKPKDTLYIITPPEAA